MKTWKRPVVQAVSSLLHNPFLSNFLSGGVYQGDAKHICVPGLNCYSCPGAVGACPIGSLQAVIGGRDRRFSFYVLGTALFFGVLLGRLICGFLCPFGFLQDLLYRIPSPKPKLPRRLDKAMRWGKYLALAAVLILPAVLTDAYGLGAPYFCKYVCPAGTLEGGIPLLLANESLRTAVGFLFSWKAAILALVLAGSVLLYRPFCKYLCPLGAIYGLLNRFSVYQMRVDESACVHCGKCEEVCGMGVDVTRNINSCECIRCGACKAVCPAHAIRSGVLHSFQAPSGRAGRNGASAAKPKEASE